MDDLKKFYTSVGISLLSIYESLEKGLKKDELSGLYDPKREDKFKILVMLRDSLKKCAIFRKEMTEKQKLVDQHLLSMRTNVICPKCKTQIVANIIGECEGQHHSGATAKFDILECPICNSEFEIETPNNWADIFTNLDLHIDALKMIIANPKKYPMKNTEKQEMLRAIESSKKKREIMNKPFNDLAHDWKIVEEMDNIEKEMYDDWNFRIKSGIDWGDIDVLLN